MAAPFEQEVGSEGNQASDEGCEPTLTTSLHAAFAVFALAATWAYRRGRHFAPSRIWRVLDLFERDGLLDEAATANMRGWSHGGGFSLDATIRIEAWDRAGLERLLRYCARPPFASERLSWEKRSERVVYELAKPRPNAPSSITLDPLELTASWC